MLALQSCFLAAWRAHLALLGEIFAWPSPPPPSRMRADVRDLLDAVHDELDGGHLVPALSRASMLLDQIGSTLRWNTGLRATLVQLVMRSVGAAEQLYGPRTGQFKRRFAIDVVLRVVSRDYLGVPLPRTFETMLRPSVGILVDWVVDVLNAERGPAWYPAPTQAKLPRRWRVGLGKRWRIALGLLRLWDGFTRWFLTASKYERQLRRTAAMMSPSAQALEQLLPPHKLARVAEKLANIIVDLGELTKPHIRTIRRIIHFARAQGGALTDPVQRHQLLVAALQELLAEAYGDDPLISSVLHSSLGGFVLGEAVHTIETIVDRSDLVPATAPPANVRLLP